MESPFIGKTATLELITKLEEQLLRHLRSEGYPFALVDHQTITADKESKSIKIQFEIKLGPKAKFSNTVIVGNSSVKGELISSKIKWNEGDPYDPAAVEETVAALENTSLFRRIEAYPQNTEMEDIPIVIELEEAKHRTVAAGVGFTSQLGPGINLEWENRNIRGLGETINIKTNLWQNLQNASILYLKPNFFQNNQNLITKGEVLREVTDGFTEYAWELTSVLERQLNENSQLSYGLGFKQLHNLHTDNNRHFNLFKTLLNSIITKQMTLWTPQKGKLRH